MSTNIPGIFMPLAMPHDSEAVIEGIILKTLPYEDNKQISTLFTPCGIMSMISYVNSKKPQTSPLTLAEFSFRKKRSDWLLLKELTFIDNFLAIRNSLPHLTAASLCIKALLSSQMPHKPVPKLYALFKAYLKHFPNFKDPKILSSSFLLKLLRHEGLLHLSLQCSSCHSKEPLGLANGALYCKKCSPFNNNILDQESLETLLILGLSQDFSSLQATSPHEDLHAVVEKLFESMI